MIRPMTPADLDAVCRLETLSFSEPWSKESFAFELNGNPYSHPVVLEEEGRLAGYAVIWLLFEQAQLASIAVDPQKRGRHLGWKLLNYALKKAKAEGCEVFTLEVRPGNTPARAMYEKRGFTPLHVSKHYYADGEDAIVMGLGL